MRFGGRTDLGVILGMALALGAVPATAQEVIGEITATINGESFEWRTLGADGSGTDYNTGLRDTGGMLDVSLMGFPPGLVAMRNVVQLTFFLMPGATGTLDQEVIYAPEGMSRMWTSLEGEDLITIEQLDASAPTGEVSGRLSGRVCLKESMFAEPDPANCKDVEGTFASRLPHEAD